MVQLSAIPEKPEPKGETDSTLASGQAKQQQTQQQQNDKGKEKAHLQLADFRDEFTTSVYGSRFAGEDLPRQQMPEERMPREVAYRLIKDDLSLDNNPILKYVFNFTGE
jgi:glutamate decarboxylase